MRGRVELGSCEGLHRLVWLGLKLEAVHVVDSVRTFVELPRVPPSPREHRRGRADGRVYPSAQGLMGRDDQHTIECSRRSVTRSRQDNVDQFGPWWRPVCHSDANNSGRQSHAFGSDERHGGPRHQTFAALATRSFCAEVKHAVRSINFATVRQPTAFHTAVAFQAVHLSNGAEAGGKGGGTGGGPDGDGGGGGAGRRSWRRCWRCWRRSWRRRRSWNRRSARLLPPPKRIILQARRVVQPKSWVFFGLILKWMMSHRGTFFRNLHHKTPKTPHFSIPS